MFPYPAVLSEEEREELASMVEPMNKWTEEVNDPLLNDKLETVPDEVMQSLAELGAFGLQVPVNQYFCFFILRCKDNRLD